MSTNLTLRISGNEGVRTVPLVLGVLARVGRSPESDIMINDPAISRQQMTIESRHTPHGIAIWVACNPQSANQILKETLLVREALVYPGEIFSIGPYRFELHAEADLPRASAGLLPPDPAGPIDVALAQEQERLVPRWRQRAGVEGASDPGRSATRGLLPLLLLLLAGGVGYVVLDDDGKSQARPQPVLKAPDLFAAMPRLECQSAEACRHRAEQTFQNAIKLRNTGARDLITVYKVAKQLHRAHEALGEEAERLSNLLAVYDEAKQELEMLFSDLYFRYQRAKRSGNVREQLGAIKQIRQLCDEDPHAFCMQVQLSYRLLREQ